jgi:hypothetical protein
MPQVSVINIRMLIELKYFAVRLGRLRLKSAPVFMIERIPKVKEAVTLRSALAYEGT